MTTLYLDRKGLEVRLDGSALALYEGDVRVNTVPLALLDRVVVRAETSLSSSVLGAMSEAGCPSLILSGRHGHRMATVQGRSHNDAAIRLAQYSATLDRGFRLAWARRFVGAKLGKAQRFLERALAQRSDRSKEIFDALETIRPLRDRVNTDAASTESLRGMEGAAQAAYFRAYGSLFPESLGFRTRNRRPPRDAVNACLSLAYTLIHFEAMRVAYAAGRDPFLGFFHEIAFGRESLACDLIEPLRPSVDAWVWQEFRTRELRPEHFKVDKGACLLQKTGRARFYEHFEEFVRPESRRLHGYCRILVRSLRTSRPELKEMEGEEEL